MVVALTTCRAAWERGERDRFFPYGKRFRAVWGMLATLRPGVDCPGWRLS